jgi:hypothetical protein
MHWALRQRARRIMKRAMTARATHRPAPFAKPAHWSAEPPPVPRAPQEDEPEGPTRYGDWVRNGIAVDF